MGSIVIIEKRYDSPVTFHYNLLFTHMNTNRHNYMYRQHTNFDKRTIAVASFKNLHRFTIFQFNYIKLFLFFTIIPPVIHVAIKRFNKKIISLYNIKIPVKRAVGDHLIPSTGSTMWWSHKAGFTVLWTNKTH